jgi:septum formation protein
MEQSEPFTALKLNLNTLVLASRSPRRAELLSHAGFRFRVCAADVDETPREGEDPRKYVLRLAEEKARAVAASDAEVVLGADTTVVFANRIMGKPVDEDDAAGMLRALSGQRHEVMTGICLKRGPLAVFDISITTVSFSPLSPAEIADYVESGEPMDKAGAYAIQGLASRFVERIEGSYSNVVGLPVALVYRLLRAHAI